MAFSSITTFIMLFFGLLIIVSSLLIIQNNVIDSTSLAYEKKDRIVYEMKTNINIENITFNNLTSPDTTTIILKNTGSTKIDLDYIDIFIDDLIIPRDSLNRTISFMPGSVTINPLHFDPDEYLKIEIFMDLINVSHVVTVTTEYGIKDTTTFLG